MLAERVETHENGTEHSGRTAPFAATLSHAEAQMDPNDDVKQERDVRGGVMMRLYAKMIGLRRRVVGDEWEDANGALRAAGGEEPQVLHLS